MNQAIEQHHKTDEQGNPTGGHTRGLGIEIQWQEGPLGRGAERKEPNGAFVEGVIQAAIGRVAFFQSSKFNCRENQLALEKLQEALYWLNARTSNREARAVEGTHAA